MIFNADGSIQLRIDTESNWETANPILKNGELAIVVTADGNKLKAGDGTHRYTELGWCGGGGSSAVEWGSIEGDISDQTDLMAELSGKANLHIGEIITSTIPLTDAGLHLLDGTVISGVGSYSAFYDYMVELYSTAPQCFCSEADWQSAVSSYGVCGKFVLNTTAKTIRLPKIEKFVEGGSVANVGSLTEAGLPNIEGVIKGIIDHGSFDPNGCFANAGTFLPNCGYVNNGGNYNGPIQTINFSASRSSSIYGNSSTVQPQSIKVLYYIVIATTTKTDIEVDIDEVMADLSLKADKTELAGKLDTSVKHIITTYVNGASGYRIWSDGYCEQWGVWTTQKVSSIAVTFTKTFKDVNYTLWVMDRANDNDTGGYGDQHCGINGGSPYTFGQSTTGFRCSTYSGVHYFSWHASGYLATGQY